MKADKFKEIKHRFEFAAKNSFLKGTTLADDMAYLVSEIERLRVVLVARPDILNRGRTCISCKKAFYAKDNRQKFCSIKCRVYYNNRERLSNGYFQDRRARLKAGVRGY